jgi:hypothetical protein
MHRVASNHRLMALSMAVAMSCAAASAAAADAAPRERPIRITVAPGKVAEVCMPLAEGDTLRWRFKASAALDFNLHHHVDSEALVAVERRGVKADSGEHRIDRRNEWCLMWTAPAGAKRVSIDGAWSSLRAP